MSVDLNVFHEDIATIFGWLNVTADERDGCGLACTIGAEQTEAFSSFDFEVQTADRFNFSIVGLAQVMTLDGDWHREILP